MAASTWLRTSGRVESRDTMPSTTTVVIRSMRSIERSAVWIRKLATVPTVVLSPLGRNRGVAARSSTVWRASARNASRICTSRSADRNSLSLSPRIAAAIVCAMTEVGSPSCAARARSTVTCNSCSPDLAVVRTESKPLICESRLTRSRDRLTSLSVDSPDSCMLNPVLPPWFSSKRKLGLPMMISGISFSICAMMSRGSMGSSSRGFSLMTDAASSGV